MRAMLPSVSLPDVAILRGVGHFADTYTVENDPDYAGKRHSSTVTSVRGGTGRAKNRLKATPP